MPLSAPKAPASSKPSACRGCSLYEKGHGFVQSDGPLNAPIAFMGEAPGYDEAALNRPFIGAAGSMLDRILRRNSLQRGQFRVGNVLQCVPPGLQLLGQSYEHPAIDHCRVYRDAFLNEGHQVVMAMGATPLKTLLGLHGHDRIRVEEFHGTVHRDRDDRFWIVPTFHPSYLQRGAHNLIGTVSYDLQVALELVRGQWKPQPLDLVIDPPVDWYRAWAQQYLDAVRQDPMAVALSCDMETPDKAGGKPENELGPDDQSYQIDRWNFCYHPDQGVTVPDDPAYWAITKQLLEAQGYHYWWNGSGYDWDRTRARGVQMQGLWQLDLMLAAHVLQSDVPLGLGFWAPFYSNYGAWKHLSKSDPTMYACIDGPQTHRVGFGIIGDLIQLDLWRAFQEDCHELYHQVLKPAQDIGILIDRPALEAFHADLEVKQRRMMHQIQSCIPESLKPLTHEAVKAPDETVLHPQARTHNLRTGELLADQPDPLKQELFTLAAVRVSRDVPKMVRVCKTCNQIEVHTKHRCKYPFEEAAPQIELEEHVVVRWYWQEPFNPDSSQQVLNYLKFRKHKPGKDKKTHKDSADRETLKRLSRSTKDPFYDHLLNYRAVKKVDSTYAVPTLRRVAKDPEGRIHPIPTFRPSMARLSYVAPNITNVVQDKGGAESLAAGFRRCVVAAPGCRLLEIDYSGIEAVETGWLSRDPAYIRLAKLGVHAYLASHLLGRPADLGWSDGDLAAYFQELKTTQAFIYDLAKRCVHGTNYGLTPFGMAATFPDLYKDQKAAERVQGIYFEVCPNLPAWHSWLRQHAYDHGFLGGPGPVLMGADNACYKKGWSGPSPVPHPFQYKHYFWSVLAYQPITEKQRLWRQKRKMPTVEINGRWFGINWGEDSKRVIAFYPQSTAAGVLKRTLREILCHPDHPNYVGDAYYGRTPFRAPIHDSGLFEIPDRVWDTTVEKIARAFQRPVAEQPLPAAWNMGTHLQVGVEAKAGRNWLGVEKIKIDTQGGMGESVERDVWPIEDEDEDDFGELGVVA